MALKKISATAHESPRSAAKLTMIPVSPDGSFFKELLGMAKKAQENPVSMREKLLASAFVDWARWIAENRDHLRWPK